MIKLSTKIGKFPVVIEFQDMKQLHKFGAVYGALPSKCTACGSDDIYLSYRNPKGNDYYTLECTKCKASANFGIHNNESKSLYWKDETMKTFTANSEPATDNKEPF